MPAVSTSRSLAQGPAPSHSVLPVRGLIWDVEQNGQWDTAEAGVVSAVRFSYGDIFFLEPK